MSFLTNIPVLDLRNLIEADAVRVTAWARANPTGRGWVGDAACGSPANQLSWFQLDRLGIATRLRAAAQREGVTLRPLIGARVDVICPSNTRFVGPVTDWPDHVARSVGNPWREALKPLENAGYTWSWPSGFTEDLVARLPEDAMIYVSSPTVNATTKHFTLGGVLANLKSQTTREWMVEQVGEIAEFWRADVLMGLKPWERNNVQMITPAMPIYSYGWIGGFVQPTPYRPYDWEMVQTQTITMLGAELEVRGYKLLTLTRPPKPSAVDLLGNATASRSVEGEAALVQWL